MLKGAEDEHRQRQEVHERQSAAGVVQHGCVVGRAGEAPHEAQADRVQRRGEALVAEHRLKGEQVGQQQPQARRDEVVVDVDGQALDEARVRPANDGLHVPDPREVDEAELEPGGAGRPQGAGQARHVLLEVAAVDVEEDAEPVPRRLGAGAPRKGQSLRRERVRVIVVLRAVPARHR